MTDRGKGPAAWFEAAPIGLRGPLKPATLEFLKFGCVGLSGIGVNLGSYFILTRLLDVPLHAASPLAIETSVLWNFHWNDWWTFSGRRTEVGFLGRLYRFHVVSFLGGAINYGILVVLVHWLGWWDLGANLAGILAGVVARFGANSSWTWQGRAGA
jgi:dolichol-phosphate mannosyltransferase